MAGRYSNYITAEGAENLRKELTRLWDVERPRVTQGVSDAAAEGDRSENAEYIYGKKRLREIHRRCRFLKKRLENLTVVSEHPPNTESLSHSWVRVEDDDGGRVSTALLGPMRPIRSAALSAKSCGTRFTG